MTEAKKKILIVEDDSMLLNIMSEKLVGEGFAVVQAQDGEEGLHKAIAEQPDLILLDVLMPKMDGVTMLKKLRATKKSLATPVILLTNVTYGPQIDEAIKHGVQDFLIKTNWKLSDVVQKIRQKLAMENHQKK